MGVVKSIKYCNSWMFVDSQKCDIQTLEDTECEMSATWMLDSPCSRRRSDTWRLAGLNHNKMFGRMHKNIHMQKSIHVKKSWTSCNAISQTFTTNIYLSIYLFVWISADLMLPCLQQSRECLWMWCWYETEVKRSRDVDVNSQNREYLAVELFHPSPSHHTR